MYLVKSTYREASKFFGGLHIVDGNALKVRPGRKQGEEDMADAGLRNYARDEDQIIWSSQLIISQATKLMSLALVCQRV